MDMLIWNSRNQNKNTDHITAFPLNNNKKIIRHFKQAKGKLERELRNRGPAPGKGHRPKSLPSTPRFENRLCLVPQGKARANEALRFKHLNQKNKSNISGSTGCWQARKEPCDPRGRDILGPCRTTRAREAMASLHAARWYERGEAEHTVFSTAFLT